VARFLNVTGSQDTGAGQAGSEVADLIFDSSGQRTFFSVKRGLGTGIIYRVTGPFRQERQARPHREGSASTYRTPYVEHAASSDLCRSRSSPAGTSR
jgi:hypothetical protein